MPPLICPSPNIVDHTFPRSNNELRLVQKALLKLTVIAEEEKCLILLTRVLSDFIVSLDQTFCWEVIERYPDVQIIYRVLAELGLQQHGVKRVDVSELQLVHTHPLPAGVESNAFSLRWTEELGRLWTLHSKNCAIGRYFIGIACTLAFAGQPKGNYENPDNLPTFPLVGPDETGNLDDSLKWDVPAGIGERKVSFKDAHNRIALLGGTVHKPTGSSHYQVRFEGARTWPLDVNIDPIPERFLKQLEPITGQKLEVIKYVLLNGVWPRRVPRI